MARIHTSCGTLSFNRTSSSTRRILNCYFEPWEQEDIVKKDNISKAKFLQNYGGLELDNIDHLGANSRICDNEMQFADV